MAKNEVFTYEIQYTKAADKFFNIHEDVRHEYENAIHVLLTGENNKKIDVKRIKGKRNDYYRIRIREYRVIYAIINNKIVVVNTILAGSRGDIYKKKGGLK